MLRHRLALICTLTAGSVLLLNCQDSSAPPTGPEAAASSAQHSMHDASITRGANPASASPQRAMQAHDAPVSLAAVSLEPFTYRGAMDPYRIRQLPQFVARSTVRSEIVMQQSVFNPGAGMWHTHPGPSFIYLVQGQIKLQRQEHGHRCSETAVYTPGSVYTETADQVHRAVVVSAEPAVVMVTRFNIPVGSPVTIPAADPGCTSFSASSQ